MNATRNRYLITFKNGNISELEVSEVLSVPVYSICNAVYYLGEGNRFQDKDILFFKGLGIVSATFTIFEKEKLSEHPLVISIEENADVMASDLSHHALSESRLTPLSTLLSPEQPMSILSYRGISYSLTEPSVTWNIDLVKAPFAWQKGITGKSVKIAVLDTGIADHPDLEIKGGISFVAGKKSFTDDHGHGTHCAGIIAAGKNKDGIKGVAPDADIYSVKILGEDGRGDLIQLLSGLCWAKNEKMHLINMSISGAATHTIAYQNAIYLMLLAGITVICASEDITDDAIKPAPAYGAITVGSLNKDLQESTQMINEPKTDMLAPGVNIYSTHLYGSYALLSGTSMATPHVTGAAALIKQKFPHLSPAEILFKLRNTTVKQEMISPLFYYDIINCDAATN